jgi:phosphatidylglycerophosphate synthase
MEGYDEDRVLLDSAVKASDGFFTTFFVSPYSRYIARWAARRGLTPNQVTTASMAIGVLAAAAFATGSRPGLVAGAVLLQAAFTADCVDGQLARYTRTFSKFGAWLDSIFDRAKEYVVFAGLAIGASRGFGDDVWALAVAAMTLQTARHTADFAFGATQHHAIASEARPPVEEPGDGVALRRAAPAVLSTSPPDADGGAGSASVADRTWPPPSPLVAAEPAADVPAKPAPPLARRIVGGTARRAIAVSRALERWRPTRWLKKILVFPIGERFAVISLAAALTTPRTTFVVVLAWGAFATLYTLAGRSIRSLSG